MGFPIPYLDGQNFQKNFLIFQQYKKRHKVTLKAWESNLKIFQNSIFQLFFNFRTRFMSKQHVWDHFRCLIQISDI